MCEHSISSCLGFCVVVGVEGHVLKVVDACYHDELNGFALFIMGNDFVLQY